MPGSGEQVPLLLNNGDVRLAVQQRTKHSDGPTQELLLWILLIPSFVEMIAERMIIPVLPIFAKEDLGASSATIGTLYAGAALGKLACNIPCGWLVSLFYDPSRNAVSKRNLLPMVLACLVLISAYICEGCATSTTALMMARLWEGAGLSLWVLGRQTFINGLVTKKTRGRYMSTVGGTTRIASIVGPYVGGFFASLSMRYPFYAQAMLSVTNASLLILILLWLDTNANGTVQQRISSTTPTTSDREQSTELVRQPSTSFSGLFVHFGLSLAGLAFFCFCTGVARETRHLLFPLEAMEMGYKAHAIGVMTSITFFVDSIMFPMAGYLMDHYGRKYAGVPSLLIMGLSAGSVPALVQLFPASLAALTLASAGCGMGNGLSSGLIMSLGGDLSPPGGHDRAKFLALYRNLADSGLLIGPWIGGILADKCSIIVGFEVLSGVALTGALWMACVLPETHAPQRDTH